jgi:hypothetical protein
MVSALCSGIWICHVGHLELRCLRPTRDLRHLRARPVWPDRLMMRRSERGSNQQDVTVARRSKQLEMRENFFFRRDVARQSPPSDVVQIRVGS